MPRKYQKIQSGGHTKAKRMIGCELCNFSEVAKPKSDKNRFKTGDICPRCNNPTLRNYDSMMEFNRAQVLKQLQDEGKIWDLEFQPVFPLHAPSSKVFNPNRSETHLYDFVADFAYNTFHEGSNSEIYIVEDVKPYSRGKPVITDVAAMKIKHFEAEYGIKVTIP